jgi:two-component system chemotaxis response regulator CheY
MHIMTVDDSRAVRLTIALTLKQAGHTVVEAACGEDALELLKTDPVDLIISDLNMPGMDGNELVRRIMAEEAYRSIPVLMLTTEYARGRLAEAKEAGAVGWMGKPFKAVNLVAAVSTISKRFGIS